MKDVLIERQLKTPQAITSNMMQKRAFLYKVIEEDKSPFHQRTYEVWNSTGQTYRIPESRIKSTCLPLEDGATGLIEQNGDGNWYWIQNEQD